jgi:D-sedoheptulose 7-phosphate isomerase
MRIDDFGEASLAEYPCVGYFQILDLWLKAKRKSAAAAGPGAAAPRPAGGAVRETGARSRETCHNGRPQTAPPGHSHEGGAADGGAMDAILDYLKQSRDVVQAALDDPAFCNTVAAIVEITANALASGHKLLLAGNGGSAGDAQHIAGEFLSRLNYDRAPTAALALTTDSSVLTAIGNDYGFERVFERQIQALGNAGDVFFALSTSGRSPNILRAIDAARGKRLAVVGLTGRSGGEMRRRCDICLHAPSDATPLIQQIHITAGHVICGLVEERLFPQQD